MPRIWLALAAVAALGCAGSSHDVTRVDAAGAAGTGAGTGAGTESGVTGTGGAGGAATDFVHPGLLHSSEDLTRMKARVASGAQPWTAGWNRLIANAHAALTWTARPAAIVYRGANGTNPENYAQLFNDAAAAYAMALRWQISGDSAYADKAIQVLDAWSAMLTGIDGTSDKFLASGLYGYQLANAAASISSATARSRRRSTRCREPVALNRQPWPPSSR